MSLFITLFIIIALLAVMDYYSHHNIGLFIAAVILAVTAGIRYNVGYDYGSYYWYYVAPESGKHFEKGYVLLNNIFRSFHFSFFTFEFVFSCVTIGLLVYFLYKNFNPGIGGLSILYYFSRFYWTRDLGQIRSSLASVICLFSIKYIREKRPIPFLIVVCIAGSIHKGAFAFVFAYIFANYFNKNLNYFKTIFYLISTLGIGIILKHFPGFVEKITHGGVYITSSAYTEKSSANIMTLVMQVVVILCYIWIMKHQSSIKENKFMNTIANVYLTGTLIVFTFIGYKTFGYRLDTILNTSEIIMVPYIINHLFKNRTVVVILNLCASFFLLYLLMFRSGSFNNFVPFMTVFSPIK